MKRYAFIYSQILQIYRAMDTISFPIEPCRIIDMIDNCRSMSYQQFAGMNQCSVEQVIQFCKSKSGCTHYDTENDRYLILWNEDGAGYNVPGRRRWTKAHELGHVVLRHFPLTAEAQLAEHGLYTITAPEYETEADCFAATLLSPMPLFDMLKIRSPVDIRYVFGLSTEASNYRWDEYARWKRTRRKASWENDFRAVILDRQGTGKLTVPGLRAANCERSRGAISIWKDPEEEDV